MAMELGEARAIVHSMKAKYASFEKLEQAIVAVEQAQGLAKEKKAHIKQLDDTIDERTALFNELLNTFNNLKDKHDNMLASYKKKSEELDTEFHATRKKQAAEIKAATNEIEQARAANKDEMATLENDKKALEKSIAALQKKLKDIRASINV